MTRLEQLDAEVEDALERVRVPAYVIDEHGIVRWVNSAAQAIVGDVRGKQLTSVVAPEEKRRAQEIFYRNLTGPPTGSDNKGVVMGASGDRVASRGERGAAQARRACHRRLRPGHPCGREGNACAAPAPDTAPGRGARSARHGRSTAQIAD